ncbi:MAG: 2-oxoacid:acceptor oxidoreductase subunit alpha [Candidatus Walczuchella monophlebidarum]
MILNQILEQVTILFSGNSGDGIQFIGRQFTNTSAFLGNNLSTLSDFPAEIRAPRDTIAGLSGFQIHFGSVEITSPGDLYDVLVVMNAAALKKNFPFIKKGGKIIANTMGFTSKSLQLAGYPPYVDPLKELYDYDVYPLDMIGHSHKLLKNLNLSKKDKEVAKNMFALGFIYWLYSRPLGYTEYCLKQIFKKNTQLLQANLNVFRAGYNFGEISETFTERFIVKSSNLPSGIYRNVTGNQSITLGLATAAIQAGLNLFYAGYPITPASDLLNYFASYKNLGIKSFQAEDEISAITSAIGASYAGDLGVTGTSGPGMALKQEGLGLAFMLELPLVIINVQRGGPSTGLPTKTEQSDLLQAIYGCHGEVSIPVLAPSSPSRAFTVAFYAAKIAIEHMTPVILLSDGYLANGSELWRFPKSYKLYTICPPFLKNSKNYRPYQRSEMGVRRWVKPGLAGYEHRIGGLEKEDETGNISYDPKNHEKMVKLRQKKIDFIKKKLPKPRIDYGKKTGKLLILSWGSTYGIVRAAIKILLDEGKSVSHTHLEYIYPLPNGLDTILQNFKKVLITELNNGQLIHLIRDQFLIDAIPFSKIQGIPFTIFEIVEKVREII